MHIHITCIQSRQVSLIKTPCALRLFDLVIHHIHIKITSGREALIDSDRKQYLEEWRNRIRIRAKELVEELRR